MIDAAERERKKLALIVEGFDFECTGMDDHDSDDCKKCIAMRERLKVTLEKWGATCANEALEKACVVTCEFCAHPDWFIEPKTSWRWRASEAKKERGGWFHVVEDQYGSFTPVACQAAAIRALKAEG